MRGKRRYLVYGGLFLLMMTSYLDRINLAVAAGPISKAYGLSPVEMGYLLSSYIWTYLLFLVPLGAAIDRWGARRITAGSLALWSFAGGLTGAVSGYGSLLATRMLLGAGEAAGYPAGGKVIRDWAPQSERGTASAWLNSGAYAGPAVGALIVGWLVTDFGWRASFIVTGGAGLILAVFWYVLYRRPEEARWLGAAEREMILQDREPAAAATPVRTTVALRTLLRSRTMWGLALSQGCAGYTLYLFMTWLPSYLETTRGMDVLKSSAFTAIPYAAAVVFGLVLGRFSDRLVNKRGNHAGGGRRALISAALLASSVILITPFVTSTWLVLTLFSISLTCVSTAMGMNIALTNDLLPNGSLAGTAISFLIFGGNVFGLLAPIVTGYAVAATGGFTVAFLIAGALLLIGTTANLTLTRRPMNAVTPAAPVLA
ncbi:MFS transporter [Streptomyces sp. NPDC000880]